MRGAAIFAADPVAAMRSCGIAGRGSPAFADGSLDLVVSALSLQFVNDLPGTLVQIRRALKPDGLLLAALIGGDTLTELRESFARPKARSKAASRRMSRPLPMCASSARCCSARALRCRWSISTG